MYQDIQCPVDALIFSPNSKILTWSVISSNTYNKLWDLANCRKEEVERTDHEARTIHSSFSENGKYFATLSKDCAIQIYNAATGVAKASFFATSHDRIRALSDFGDMVATSGWTSNKLYIFRQDKPCNQGIYEWPTNDDDDDCAASSENHLSFSHDNLKLFFEHYYLDIKTRDIQSATGVVHHLDWDRLEGGGANIKIESQVLTFANLKTAGYYGRTHASCGFPRDIVLRNVTTIMSSLIGTPYHMSYTTTKKTRTISSTPLY